MFSWRSLRIGHWRGEHRSDEAVVVLHALNRHRNLIDPSEVLVKTYAEASQPILSTRREPRSDQQVLKSMDCATPTLVACTGGDANRPSAPTGSAAIALVPDAQHYSAIVAPIDPAPDTFATESGALPIEASVDDFVIIARPFANTVADVDSKLRQVKWPAVTSHDIKAELTADQSLRSDLIGTADVTLILSLWRHQIISAAKRATDAKRTVSIDLGLPAPSATKQDRRDCHGGVVLAWMVPFDRQGPAKVAVGQGMQAIVEMDTAEQGRSMGRTTLELTREALLGGVARPVCHWRTSTVSWVSRSWGQRHGERPGSGHRLDLLIGPQRTM